MATQSIVIAREIGTAQQITDWQNDYNTARDNGYAFVFGCAVGTKLVAVLEKQGTNGPTASFSYTTTGPFTASHTQPAKPKRARKRRR